jgi:hypothetical protein
MATTDPDDVYATCTAAADYLERHGLYREGFWPGSRVSPGEFTPGDPVCLYGAIAAATGLTSLDGIDLVIDEPSCPASLAVLIEIQARHGDDTSIPYYSDEIATGAAEIVALLRDVAAKHQPDQYHSAPGGGSG